VNSSSAEARPPDQIASDVQKSHLFADVQNVSIAGLSGSGCVQDWLDATMKNDVSLTWLSARTIQFRRPRLVAPKKFRGLTALSAEIRIKRSAPHHAEPLSHKTSSADNVLDDLARIGSAVDLTAQKCNLNV
jgi:hypothetical protein